MLRNKEYRIMVILMFLVLFAFGIIECFINPITGTILIISDLILIGLSIQFSRNRYKDIEQLSSYLRKIYNGDYTLDIRDNMEGELSILKNDIYKVTLILSKQAEQLKTEKEQLADALSDISHQLKTPLTSMMVMADLLNDAKLSEDKRKEFTKNLEIQLTRMEWLLTSLLKLSKIDAGTAKFKNEPVNVDKLINQAVKPLLIPMELKNQSLVIRGNSSVTFKGDLLWTIEAIINIIKNCIEHTPIGGEITIQYEENPICTEIKVSDSGIGIPKEDLPFVFKRFYRGKNASDDSVGIGLAMAKSIIKNQNGDIVVMNGKKHGVEFSVKFYKQIL